MPKYYFANNGASVEEIEAAKQRFLKTFFAAIEANVMASTLHMRFERFAKKMGIHILKSGDAVLIPKKFEIGVKVAEVLLEEVK